MELNIDALIFGLLSLPIMGAYYPVVIRGEYYFSRRIWPLFALTGLSAILWSARLSGLACWLVAFFGAVNLWAIAELFEQEKRVRAGRYPQNPRRRYD